MPIFITNTRENSFQQYTQRIQRKFSVNVFHGKRMDFVPTFGQSAATKKMGSPIYKRVNSNSRPEVEIPFSRVLKTSGSPDLKEHFPVDAHRVEKETTLINEISPVLEIPKEDLPKEILNRIKQPKLTDTERGTIEEKVRLHKRKRQKCPFAGINGECCKPDIRCGERSQFSGRETNKQQSQPHRCLYSPYFSGDNVVIVEPDPMMREFLLNTFKIFLNFDMEKIIALSSAEEAMQQVQKFKLQNRLIGLLIINTDLPGAGAYTLVNDIFKRNCNSEIVLIGESELLHNSSKSFLGEKEIEPGLPFIASRLQTPVHTERLIDEINRLHFGKFL